jgi:hypothetical protein
VSVNLATLAVKGLPSVRVAAGVELSTVTVSPMGVSEASETTMELAVVAMARPFGEAGAGFKPSVSTTFTWMPPMPVNGFWT